MKSKPEVKLVSRFSEGDIARRVAELAREIRDDAGDQKIFLIPILRGSAIFFADLIRAIPGRVGYRFVDVVQDEMDAVTASALELSFFSHFDMSDRYVILLKDVVTTGVIESYLIDQFKAKNPRALRLGALLDRPGMRTMDLRTDYAAFVVDHGMFAGYGLEYEGEYANLPWIAEVDARR